MLHVHQTHYPAPLNSTHPPKPNFTKSNFSISPLALTPPMSSTQSSPTCVDAAEMPQISSSLLVPKTKPPIGCTSFLRPWRVNRTQHLVLGALQLNPVGDGRRDEPRSRRRYVYPSPILAPWKFQSSLFQSGYVLFFIQFFGVTGLRDEERRGMEKSDALGMEKSDGKEVLCCYLVWRDWSSLKPLVECEWKAALEVTIL